MGFTNTNPNEYNLRFTSGKSINGYDIIGGKMFT